MPTEIILASTSPYRKAVLEKLGLPFQVAAPAIDETRMPAETAHALVTRLAQTKAQAIAGQFPASLIIGSDQVAMLGNDILGKPGTHERAAAQLRQASGATVTFLTGLCLLNSATGHRQVEVVPYAVEFRILSDAQIENYLVRERPYDCAGSFKSEALGIALFERLSGDDPNALIGLPLIRLLRMLENEGVHAI